jgi:thioredoxin reductase (NADPH)
VFDLVIIGAGPAGLSCAMTARQRALNVLTLSHPGASDWLERAERIDNYPGMPGVSGHELLLTLRAQAAGMGAQLRTGLVRQVLPLGDSFSVSVGNDFVDARAVCLCMGARKPRLLPGEEALIGRGVSYCGTCDGLFYRGKTVAVVAQAKEAVEEANFLSNLCQKVHYFGAPDDALDARIAVHSQKPEAILGDARVTGLRAGGESFPADGVFVFRDAVALTQLLPGLESDGPFIRVSRDMRTSVPRVYAAGDAAGKPLQIAKAVGEGCIAALSAAEDLAAHSS